MFVNNLSGEGFVVDTISAILHLAAQLSQTCFVDGLRRGRLGLSGNGDGSGLEGA
jgi:hypothetical protein